MFVEITDPDKAAELYSAGLLWDSYMGGEKKRAERWRLDMIRHWIRSGTTFRFFVFLEE